MTGKDWHDGKECDRHEMSWCSLCNPNANSHETPKTRKKPRSKVQKAVQK